jgi:hypothetical protein
MPREWRLIDGFERYAVSSDGLVYSLITKRVLSPGWQTGGYLFVGLRRDARGHNRKVHVLVAEAFIGPRPKGLVINHIDGDKLNNRVENLEYVTFTENIRHAVSLGLRGKLSPEDAGHIRADRAAGETCRSIAERYGVHQTLVSMIARNKVWRAA